MDVRRVDRARIRAWGDELVTFCKITGDATYDELFQVTEDFFVGEVRDEASERMMFEFRFYGYEVFDLDDLQNADLLLFTGRKMEIESRELKKRAPAHYKVVAMPIGEVA
ncbi:MAG: hypothetical protein AB7U82_27635 [Blastocatellales bacterium]